jgi:hypothetical protein
VLAARGDESRVWEKILWRNLAELRADVPNLVGSGLTKIELDAMCHGIRYRPSGHKGCPAAPTSMVYGLQLPSVRAIGLLGNRAAVRPAALRPVRTGTCPPRVQAAMTSVRADGEGAKK